MRLTSSQMATLCLGVLTVLILSSSVVAGAAISSGPGASEFREPAGHDTVVETEGDDVGDGVAPVNKTESNESVPATLDRSDHPEPAMTMMPQEAGAEVSQKVIVVVTAEKQINETRIQELGATVIDQNGRAIEMKAPANELSAIAAIEWVESVRPEIKPAQTAISEGVSSVQADQLHDLGVTGSGAKVGVLTLGVQPSSTEYSNKVAESRSFHAGGIEGSDSTHGTAVTEIVSDTAPDAELYLTSFDSIVSYADATAWLRENDVDVIVISAGWQSLPDGSESYVRDVAADAATDGITYVAAAGNAGQKHWTGQATDTDEDGWIEISGDEETNSLGGGRTYTAGREVRFTVSWDRSNAESSDYTLYLIDERGEPVAESQELGEFGLSVEVLQATIPADGNYAIAIAGEASQQMITVFGSDNTSPFEHYVTEGSLITPASANGVFAVGAYDVATGQRTQYSSAGPTEDGRQGVSVLAPTAVTTRAYDRQFGGTSASAPHVGGAAALLQSLNQSASARTVEAALTSTAIDVGAPGPDPYNGAGKVDVTTAAEQLDPAVGVTLAANRTEPAAGQWVTYRVIRNDTATPVEATVAVDGGGQVRQAGDKKIEVYYPNSGEYELNVTPTANPPTADFLPQQVSVEIREQQRATVSVLDLSKRTVSPGDPVTISASVKNPTDTVTAAEVTFYADGEAFKSRTYTVSPGDSVVTIGTTNFTEPGTHTIQVNEMSPVEVEVRSNTSVTTETGSVQGKVTTQGGPAVESATVVLADTETSEQIRTTTTNQNGDYLFADLKPGEYQLRVQHNGRMKRESVTVVSGVVTEATVEFEPQDVSRVRANLTVGAPSTIPAGETADLVVTVRNTGTATAGVGAVQIDLTGPVSIESVSGDGVNSPSRFFTAPIGPGGTRTTTYTLQAAAGASGEATIQLTASVGTESTAESSVVTRVEESSQTLRDHFERDDGRVTFQEVLKAINVYNRERQRLEGFGDVTFNDVLSAIEGYNTT